MPLMLMARNWTVATPLGHTVVFEKDTPIFIPDDQRVIEACLAVGASYVDAAPVLPDQPVKTAPVALSKAVVQEKCFELYRTMVNNPEEHRQNFTAFGRPNAKFVSSTLGVEVSAKDVEEFWVAYQKKKV